MTISATIYGLQRFEDNLDAEYAAIGRGVDAGLRKAGLALQRASQLIVPIDLGILRASAYTRRLGAGTGLDTVVGVGYTASYAGMVHEDMNLAHGTAYNAKYAYRIASKLHYYREPEDPPGGKKSWPGGVTQYHQRGVNQQAKFLLIAAQQNFTLMSQIVQNEIKSAKAVLGARKLQQLVKNTQNAAANGATNAIQ